MLTASQALDRFLALSWKRCLDIGSGYNAEHAEIMRDLGRVCDATDISIEDKFRDGTFGWNIRADFFTQASAFGTAQYDAVWCSHFLEHVPNVDKTLFSIKKILKPGGVLCVTVPPLKHEIVGGHVNLFNPGLLLYRLVLAGFDCSKARVGVYDYNISVLIERVSHCRPGDLRNDSGDIEALAKHFPMPVKQGFDGNTGNINWR